MSDNPAELYCSTDSPDCRGDIFRAEIERLRSASVHDWGYWYVDKRVYDELCAEIEQLKAGMREYACTGSDHPCGCYDQFLSERAEIERLRASVKTMVNEREQERKVYNDAIARHLADNERLRDLLAFNGIDPDATIEAAKGAASAGKR